MVSFQLEIDSTFVLFGIFIKDFRWIVRKKIFVIVAQQWNRELEVRLVVGRKLHSVILDFTRKPARALPKCKYIIWKSPKLLSLMNAKCT